MTHEQENSLQGRCSLGGSERAACFVNTNVKRSKTSPCLRRSSSVYHKHPEFYPKKVVIRANPVPAHTYLSSDQVIQIRRYPHVREVRPFSFYERDQEIKKRKVERFLKVLEEEKKKRECKARPVPAWIFKTSVSTNDVRSPEAQMQRNPRQLAKTQTIRTTNQNKIEHKKPIFNSIHIANQGGDSKAVREEMDKKDYKQQSIQESGKSCSIVPVQKKVLSTVSTHKKKPSRMPVQATVISRVPAQKKIASTVPPQKKKINLDANKSISAAVPKNTKKDRKAILVPSKAEQKTTIQPGVDQNEGSFKIKRTTSEIFTNYRNKVQPTNMDKFVEERSVVSGKVPEKIQKSELKKKTRQKEKCKTQKNIRGSNNKTKMSKMKNSVNAKSKKAHKSASLENSGAQFIPAVPKNSAETLGTYMADSIKNTLVNKRSIDYSQFFEELKTMNKALKSDLPPIRKVSAADVFFKRSSMQKRELTFV